MLDRGTAHPQQQVDHLTAAEVGPQAHVSRDVRQAAMQVGRASPGILVEKAHLPGVLADQTQQDPQGGGLAGAVGAEEPVHLARPDREVEAVQRPGGAEGLDQTVDVDDSVRHAAHPATDGGDPSVPLGMFTRTGRGR
jgi:hypothetical protein